MKETLQYISLVNFPLKFLPVNIFVEQRGQSREGRGKKIWKSFHTNKKKQIFRQKEFREKLIAIFSLAKDKKRASTQVNITIGSRENESTHSCNKFVNDQRIKLNECVKRNCGCECPSLTWLKHRQTSFWTRWTDTATTSITANRFCADSFRWWRHD